MLRKTIIIFITSFFANSAVAVTEMFCVAEHTATEQQFYGQGIKFVASKKALAACDAFAQKENANPTACKISYCEPLLPF